MSAFRFCCLGLWVLLACQPSEPARPNFLIIFTDDQRHDALGCAGNPHMITPNLDSLCRAGTRFSHAFVTLSICSPSRAALLTGRYGRANGIQRVGNVSLREGERTFAQLLREHGYQTGMVGKWHLGNPPAACGFESYAYFESNGTYYHRPVTEGPRQTVADQFIEAYNADKAMEFMQKREKDRPFVLFLCPQIPHMDHTFDWDVRPETQALYRAMDIQPPASWQDDLSGKPAYLRTNRSRQRAQEVYHYEQADSLINHIERYRASITELDAELGRVFRYLQRQQLTENTYVILMGDNGWFLGEHMFTSKVLPYEESMRVPLLLAGPTVPAKVVDELVLNIDIAPTLLEWAGLDVPTNMHGRSLKPLLEGNATGWRSAVYYEAPEPQLGSQPLAAVRDARWKYIQTYASEQPDSVIFEELYDVQTDPYELTNLAQEAEQAGRLARMARQLDELRAGISP